jgi:hypothetical protein
MVAPTFANASGEENQIEKGSHRGSREGVMMKARKSDRERKSQGQQGGSDDESDRDARASAVIQV